MIPLSQTHDETDAFPLSQWESTDEEKKTKKEKNSDH